MSGFPLSLEQPWILLVLVALIAASVVVARRSDAGQPREIARITLGLRILLLTLLCLALGGLSLVHRGEGLTVVVLRDHSASVPVAETDRIIAQLAQQKPARDHDQIGLISFGRDAVEEMLPQNKELEPSGAIRTDREGTDLAEAFRLADSMFTGARASGGRRVVLVSDGNATEGDTLLAARNLAAAGAVIDVIPIRYSYEREAMVEQLRVPSDVHPEEPYLVEAVIDTELPGEGVVQLYENDELIEERTVDFAAGKNRVEFPRVQVDRGRYTYRLQLLPGDGRDTLPGNNVGYGFTQVRGEPRILFVAKDLELQRPLLDSLASSRLACEVIGPDQVSTRPQDYLSYSAIVLADVSAYDIGPDAMEAIHGVVRNIGVGLLMIGSPDTFGAGGYRGTPIERALPVEMDVRQRKSIPNGALAIVLHTCEFPAGNMWAKQIATAAIDALTPQDLAGVLIYDTMGRDRWGVPIQRVQNRAAIINTIRALQPADMPSFAPTMALGLAGLKSAPAVSKHMVIVSDGDPMPPSAATMQGFIDAGISVSTICIQPHGGRDTGVMKKIALDTGGRYYRADDPRQLPQIFFREAIQVRRNLIQEKPFTPRIGVVVDAIRGLAGGGFPELHGYVMTTPKPLAEVALTSDEEDPVFAQWRYGLGRTAAFTSDATARWGKGWIGWAGYETFWAQLLRSISRRAGAEFLESSHRIEGEQGVLTVDAIDAEGRFIDGLALTAQVLDPELGEQTVELTQVGPGRYQQSFRAGKSGSYLVTYSYEGPGGLEGLTTAGFDVAFPLEFRHLRSDDETLAAIAESTGGRIIEPTEDIFRREELPVRSEKQPIWIPLLQWALMLFFLDIFLRRVAVNWSSLLTPIGKKAGAKRASEASTEGATTPAAGSPIARGRVAERRLETAEVAASDPDAATDAAESGGRRGKRARGKEEKKRAAEIPTVTSQLLRAKKAARKKTDDQGRRE